MRKQVTGLVVGPVRQVHWLMLDCAVAVVLLVLSVGHVLGQRAPSGAPLWLAVPVGVAATLPVAVRRLRPVPVFTVVLAANGVLTAVGLNADPAVAVALTLYAVVVSRSPRRSVAALAVAGGVTAAAQCYPALAAGRGLPRATLLELVVAEVVILVAAWGVAAAVAEQRRYAARVAEERRRTAMMDERLRIARDLHDVVAHSLTVITAKAAVTNYLIESHPDQVRDALTMIEKTGRQTLTEIRRVLGTLRADHPAAHTPIGLPELRELAATAGAAGVDTRLQVRGARQLPPALSLTVYRIVQEALTNVIKHAAPARGEVLVDITDGWVDVQVSDDGRPTPAPGGGHGLVGMRERVSMHGGTFTAGPRAQGGWLVTARLPLSAKHDGGEPWPAHQPTDDSAAPSMVGQGSDTDR